MMRMNVNKCMQYIILLIVFSLSIHGFVIADENGNDHVEVKLLCDYQSITAGQNFRIGVQFKLEPEWHIYWRNAGDSGLPPSVKWELPNGFSLKELDWPLPDRLVTSDIATYIYHDTIVLLYEISAPDKIGDKEITLSANVDWLICKESCIPGNQKITLQLPVGEVVKNLKTSKQFAQLEKLLPRNGAILNPLYKHAGSTLVFKIDKNTFHQPVKNAYFFPNQQDLIQHAAEQEIQIKQNFISLEVPVSQYAEMPDGEISGLLKIWFENGDVTGYEVAFQKYKGEEELKM